MRDLEAKIQYLLDLEEIRQLMYRYCQNNDGGWPARPLTHQGPSADLFVEDGVWDARPLAGIAEGREAIRKVIGGYATMPMAYHAVTNPIIEITGDTAKAHWHLVGGRVDPNGNSSIGLSGYDMEYVRRPEGWRIKLMRVIWGRRANLPEGWSEHQPKVN